MGCRATLDTNALPATNGPGKLVVVPVNMNVDAAYLVPRTQWERKQAAELFAVARRPNGMTKLSNSWTLDMHFERPVFASHNKVIFTEADRVLASERGDHRRLSGNLEVTCVSTHGTDVLKFPYQIL